MVAGGRYLALAQSPRTWCQVRVIETDTWTVWEVSLPDGGPISEHTFWGTWLDGDTLRLTVGRGGDQPQSMYRCSLRMENGQLIGLALEETAETLPGDLGL